MNVNKESYKSNILNSSNGYSRSNHVYRDFNVVGKESVTLSSGFGNDPTKIGEITEIGLDYIKIDSVASAPGSDDFIMFSKNKSVNNSSLLGYYAEVKLTNDSDKKAELFALGSEVSESSK